MSTIENPSAFPFQEIPGGQVQPEYGMTLRDWFAGMMIEGMGPWMPPADHGPFNWDDWDAVCALRGRYAYRQADAMLAARSTKDQADV